MHGAAKWSERESCASLTTPAAAIELTGNATASSRNTKEEKQSGNDNGRAWAGTVTEDGNVAPQHCRNTAFQLIAGVAVGATALAMLTACGDKNKKTYDIAPIFPLSSDKCSKYEGDATGSGLASHCYVTKDECKKAVADWRAAM